MNSKKNWLGWIAIGMGGLALLVALFGRGFGPQMAAAGGRGFNSPPFAQQDQQRGGGQQRGQFGPGANAQPNNAQPNNAQPNNAQPNNAQPNNVQPNNVQPGNMQQRGPGGPGANAQPGNMQQRGQGGPGANAQRGPGRPGDAGRGGWFPLGLIGGSFKIGMLALLVLFGVLLLRRRNVGGAQSQPATVAAAPAPAQAPLSPTGEAYTEEPSDQE